MCIERNDLSSGINLKNSKHFGSVERESSFPVGRKIDLSGLRSKQSF